MSRRCLICANINPCRLHTEAEQESELRRNDAAIAAIRNASRVGAISDQGKDTRDEQTASLPQLGGENG